MTIAPHQGLVPAMVLQLAAPQQLRPAQQRSEGPRLQHREHAAVHLYSTVQYSTVVRLTILKDTWIYSYRLAVL